MDGGTSPSATKSLVGGKTYGAVNTDGESPGVDVSSKKLCSCTKKKGGGHKNDMGTFNGVFIPCALNIMGKYNLKLQIADFFNILNPRDHAYSSHTDSREI